MLFEVFSEMYKNGQKFLGSLIYENVFHSTVVFCPTHSETKSKPCCPKSKNRLFSFRNETYSIFFKAISRFM